MCGLLQLIMLEHKLPFLGGWCNLRTQSCIVVGLTSFRFLHTLHTSLHNLYSFPLHFTLFSYILHNLSSFSFTFYTFFLHCALLSYILHCLLTLYTAFLHARKQCRVFLYFTLSSYTLHCFLTCKKAV